MSVLKRWLHIVLDDGQNIFVAGSDPRFNVNVDIDGIFREWQAGRKDPEVQEIVSSWEENGEEQTVSILWGKVTDMAVVDLDLDTPYPVAIM